MPRSIQDVVSESGKHIENDELVNFGSCQRDVIDPSTGPRSYWFRFGDIHWLTLPQLQAAIGAMASAGMPGGANWMRVSMRDVQDFTPRAPTGFLELAEYTIDIPVVVKCSVDVGSSG
jgi:hypothetical protein